MISGCGSLPCLRSSPRPRRSPGPAARTGRARPARAARRAGRASGSARAAVHGLPAAAGRARSTSPRASASATLTASSVQVGQELVQRRVDQPDRHRQPVHRRQELGEVLALQRQQRRQRGSRSLVALGQDQPLDLLTPVAEEHVLGAAQADALGAEPAGPLGVLAGVGVGPHPQPADRVGVGQIRCTASTSSSTGPRPGSGRAALEVVHDRGVRHRHLAEEDLAGGAVDRDDVALVRPCRRARS